jgi:hypothetical protein
VDKRGLLGRTRGLPCLHMLFWGLREYLRTVGPDIFPARTGKTEDKITLSVVVWVVCLVAWDFENVRVVIV